MSCTAQVPSHIHELVAIEAAAAADAADAAAAAAATVTLRVWHADASRDVPVLKTHVSRECLCCCCCGCARG
jgi:hypothetical protein